MQLVLKSAGAIVVFCVCALLGWLRGERAAQRGALLEQLADFLLAAENNLRYRKDDTRAVLQEAAAASGLPLALQDCPRAEFPQMLKQALVSLWKTAACAGAGAETEEKRRFAAAVERLGTTCAEEEVQTLAYEADFLRRQAAQVRQQAAAERKIYRAVGLSGGAALTLLIW